MLSKELFVRTPENLLYGCAQKIQRFAHFAVPDMLPMNHQKNELGVDQMMKLLARLLQSVDSGLTIRTDFDTGALMHYYYLAVMQVCEADKVLNSLLHWWVFFRQQYQLRMCRHYLLLLQGSRTKDGL